MPTHSDPDEPDREDGDPPATLGGSLLRLPFFAELEGARRILLAGAGGGFDIFCGLPLYFGLKAAGREVFLANLSFSDFHGSTANELAPGLAAVYSNACGGGGYFPELHLTRWFAARGEILPIYCFGRMGVQPLLSAYQALVEFLQLDALVLVDGGTDSLMRGDEAGLGTPLEDVTSIAAVDALPLATKLLVCAGFGLDVHHGVCHAQFLEGVSELIRADGFLGIWSLTREMPEVQLYREATETVFQCMPHHPSILSAIQGEFGDHHATRRTSGSTLFINPLMSLYWCFRLSAVANRILYMNEIRDTHTAMDVVRAIDRFRLAHDAKPWVRLPM